MSYKLEDFQKYQKDLFAVARKLTRSYSTNGKDSTILTYRKDVIEDILQNSFLIYHKRLNDETIDPKKSLEKQLISIVWRESMNSFSRGKYKLLNHSIIDTDLLPEIKHPIHDDYTVEKMQVEEIYKFIYGLNKTKGERTMRNCMLLYLEGFTQPEIKDKLKLSRRTVGEKLSECRTALKKAFVIHHTKLNGQK